MEFHIGELIKKRAKERRIGPTELGKLINTSKQNVYGIFKRQSIDTELLRKLSEALEYDFFYDYVKTLSFYDKTGQMNSAEIRKEVEECKTELDQRNQEIDVLKRENDFIRRINELLEEKVGGSKK